MLLDSTEGSGWTGNPRWASCPVCNYFPSLANTTTDTSQQVPTVSISEQLNPTPVPSLQPRAADRREI